MNRIILSKLFLFLGDFISFFFSLFIALFLLPFFGSVYGFFPTEQVDNYVNIHFFTTIVCVGWFQVRLRHYTYRKPFWFELKEILRTLFIFLVIELSIITLSKLYVPRALWMSTWGILFFLVPFIRVVLKKVLIRSEWYLKDTIIIGSNENALDAYNALLSEKYLGLNVKYFVFSGKDSVNHLNIPIILSDKLWELSEPENTQIIIALEDREIELRDYWLRELATKKYRSISIIPTLRGLPLYGTDMSFLFSQEMILLRINNNLAKRSSRILKRTIDIFGSLLIMIMLSPLLIILYCLIARDGGSAIYGHPRIGRNGKIFKCLKFRSMVINSRELLEELLKNDPVSKAEWDKDFKLKNDPRITKVGAFIRKTSLDELPQLWNVLKGEMSLVGPRPIVADELERYEEDVDYYLMAKPGMTGLWQVSGRNDVNYETRVYFDSWYVKNWSLWNDIAILFKTIKVVFKRNGAY